MGRKSALTLDQWAEVERRIILEGESVYKLAQEYGVNESSIRRKLKPNKADKAEFGAKAVPELREIAARKVAADAESKSVASVIGKLPFVQQQMVMTLSQRLINISNSIASAAEFGAATAHRLAGIANAKVAEIDDAEPLNDESRNTIRDIAVLTHTANQASEIAINLIKANKDSIDDLNRREIEKADAREQAAVAVPDDDMEAANAYMQLMKG